MFTSLLTIGELRKKCLHQPFYDSWKLRSFSANFIISNLSVNNAIDFLKFTYAQKHISHYRISTALKPHLNI